MNRVPMLFLIVALAGAATTTGAEAQVVTPFSVAAAVPRGGGALSGENPCGTCWGVIGVTHIFGGNQPEEVTHQCDHAGCHGTWYVPGCQVHRPCFLEEDQDQLAAAIDAGEPQRVLDVMSRLTQTFEFDETTGTIDAYCGGYLTVRFSLPDDIESRAFVASLGLQ